MYWLKIEDFEVLCYSLACELFVFDQPFPPFSTRFIGVLESCLSSPLQQAGGKDLYPDFEDKIAFLFYLMIKNHPFLNGNKRLAIATLLVTLFGNKKWLKVGERIFYDFAVEVSSSKREDKDAIIVKIKKFVVNNLIEIR